MNWTDFDFWKFLAGLGIFMFGMFLLEEAISQLSGRTFKRLIRKSTTGRVRSVFAGAFSTTILQSSTAVTLMTITFTGAGIITLQNAIGVVLGANLGTTATSWVVATIGFKVNIESLFLPLIGTGGLGLIFLSKSPRYNGISKLLVALGFLFMGLEYMKLSVEDFTATFNLATLPHYGTWFYVVIAILLTALTQSSTATVAIVLTALHTELITFHEGAAMVIGANMGTPSTVMLGTIGAVPIKKQVALSHLIFNFSTGIVAFLALPLLTSLTLFLVDGESNAVMGLALFHTIFNLLGVLMLFPFTGYLVRFIKKVYPEKADGITQYIGNISSDLPEAAEAAVKKETFLVFGLTLKLISKLLHLEEKPKEKGKERLFSDFFSSKKEETPLELFENIQQINKNILIYASKISTDELEASEKRDLSHMNHIIVVITQVTKTLMSIIPELEETESSENKTVEELLQLIRNTTHNHLITLQQISENTIQKETHEVYQNKINQDYKVIVDKISLAISEKTIQEKHISSLLMINGFLTQSIRQLFRALEKLS